MKERPIIMTGESVRAILDGRKTQTRRVITPSRYMLRYTKERHDGFASLAQANEAAASAARSHLAMGYDDACPSGQPGDHLWVRESFAIGRAALPNGVGFVPFTGTIALHVNPGADEKVVYKAGNEYPLGDQPPWRPSIHMPRRASRLTLEITSVRVERLQEISKADALAEGTRIPVTEKQTPCLQLSGKYPACQYPPFNSRETIKTARLADWLRAYYASTWDNLNAKRGFPWSSNPWVWVIEFKRIDADAKAAA